MNVILTEDEIRLILQAVQACSVAVLSPDAGVALRTAQGLARKLRPKPPKNSPAKKKKGN